MSHLMFKLLLRVFILGHVVLAKFLLEGDSSYDLILKQVRKCKNEGSRLFAFEDIRVTRVSRAKSLFSAVMVNKVLIDNNIIVEITAAVQQNGGWTNNFFNFKIGPVCTKLNEMMPIFFKTLVKHIGKPCPFPVGNFTIEKMPMILDFHLPFIPFNSYKIDAFLKIKEKLIGCIQYYVDIVPKKN